MCCWQDDFYMILWTNAGSFSPFHHNLWTKRLTSQHSTNVNLSILNFAKYMLRYCLNCCCLFIGLVIHLSQYSDMWCCLSPLADRRCHHSIQIGWTFSPLLWHAIPFYKECFILMDTTFRYLGITVYPSWYIKVSISEHFSSWPGESVFCGWDYPLPWYPVMLVIHTSMSYPSKIHEKEQICKRIILKNFVFVFFNVYCTLLWNHLKIYHQVEFLSLPLPVFPDCTVGNIIHCDCVSKNCTSRLNQLKFGTCQM